jgi:glycosyltransferase involved in cell wall biosynthesis
VVSPHQVEYISPVKLKPNKSDSLHIGVLGAIGIHKGFNIIKEMLGLIAKEHLQVKILVIGHLCEMLDSENLLITGEYRREDLPALVEQHQIDIFFQPSICPETFSFTTAEVMMMELPLAVFNLGAPAERVRNYEKGLVIEKMEARYALEELLKFGENLWS